MHLLSYLSIGVALSSSLAAAHLRDHHKRYNTAPVKPTSCPTYTPTKPPSTETCRITGLPNSIDSAITYPSSTILTTWATPPLDANWQVILDKDINYDFPSVAVDNVKVYDIDLDSDQKVFDSWYSIPRPGWYLICYFSAGTSEEDRNDINCFNKNRGAQDFGCNYGDNSPDENWLNTTSREVRRVMLSRLDKAKERKCHAVDPDNMDGYSNGNGIGQTIVDSAEYMDFLITEAHHRGLGIGLKNSEALAANKSLTDRLDFAVVEECFTSLVEKDGKMVNSCDKVESIL